MTDDGNHRNWQSTLARRLADVLALKPESSIRSPSIEAVRAAFAILDAIMPAPEYAAPAVIPTADGGMQLEWHQSGRDVEIYIDATGEMQAFGRSDEDEWEEDARLDYVLRRTAGELARMMIVEEAARITSTSTSMAQRTVDAVSRNLKEARAERDWLLEVIDHGAKSLFHAARRRGAFLPITEGTEADGPA